MRRHTVPGARLQDQRTLWHGLVSLCALSSFLCSCAVLDILNWRLRASCLSLCHPHHFKNLGGFLATLEMLGVGLPGPSFLLSLVVCSVGAAGAGSVPPGLPGPQQPLCHLPGL